MTTQTAGNCKRSVLADTGGVVVNVELIQVIQCFFFYRTKPDMPYNRRRR